MARLAFWAPPFDDYVDRIKVYKGATASTVETELTEIRARNRYGNWVTHYHDTAETTDVYYQARFIKSGVEVERSEVRVAETPFAILPQDVINQVQGVPSMFMEASLIHELIGDRIAYVEYETDNRLQSTQVLKEVHGVEAWESILGQHVGRPIQLRHFPVLSTAGLKIYVSILGQSNRAWQEITGIDLEMLNQNTYDNYSRGQIIVYPTYANIEFLLGQINFHGPLHPQVLVAFDYSYGYASIPRDLKRAIIELAAAEALEIMGEAATGGLSSRSIDGYSESFTASATTTQFSGRRIYYTEKAEKTLARYKKVKWA